MIAMDAASSEWKSEKGVGFYKQPKSGLEFTSDTLIDHWAALCEKYPIISIEDALDEEDWEGWKKLTERLGDKVQLVGDEAALTLSSSSSTRSVPFPRLLRLSRWLTRPATQLSPHTVPVRQLIPPSLTSLLLSTPARSRPALPAVPSVLRSTISSSESKRNSAMQLSIPRWALST